MSVAKFYPFNGRRGRLRLGLSEINFSEWFHYEDDFVSRINEKKALFKNESKNVLDTLESSIDAQKEFLQLVLRHIEQYHADLFVVSDKKITSKKENFTYHLQDYDECPLELASFLVADDICLLNEDGEDYKLAAASVCAPTWWSLPEKIGKPLTDIHAPIADLEDKIGRMIRHFLQNLRSEDCYQRSNWFLFTSADLCIFPNSFDFYTDMTSINSENIEANLYLRSERQTFRRLKNSNSIAFTIKVYVEPISIVKECPKIAQDLKIALRTMTAEQKQALGISFVEEPLKAYLN